MLPCFHDYHVKCIDRWLKVTPSFILAPPPVPHPTHMHLFPAAHPTHTRLASAACTLLFFSIEALADTQKKFLSSVVLGVPQTHLPIRTSQETSLRL